MNATTEEQGGSKRKWNGCYNKARCPECGRFCSDALAILGWDGGIESVSATCKKHGRVDVSAGDWDANDFVSPGSALEADFAQWDKP